MASSVSHTYAVPEPLAENTLPTVTVTTTTTSPLASEHRIFNNASLQWPLFPLECLGY